MSFPRELLKELYENDQVVFKYVDDKGCPTSAANPNGSQDNIAAISNLEKNVLSYDATPGTSLRETSGLSGWECNL